MEMQDKQYLLKIKPNILTSCPGYVKKLYTYLIVGIIFPLYDLSSYESTFLVGKRPVNVCKKLDVSVCEDIRLQLRSIAYGVKMNEWRDNIKVCCEWLCTSRIMYNFLNSGFNNHLFYCSSHFHHLSCFNDNVLEVSKWLLYILSLKGKYFNDYINWECCKEWNFYLCDIHTCMYLVRKCKK